MKRTALLTMLAMTAVTLAGCADAEADLDNDVSSIDRGVDKEEFKLASGTGALAGLLVDDRFRPIHLTDEPETEFQARGFILLQETGQRVKTDENGQFAFVDLEPGTYTLRVTADGHEASPTKATVESGLFTDLSVVARRISTESNLILTEERSGFVPCAAVVPAITITFGCSDASGESYRTGIFTDYSDYDNVTYMITESLLRGGTDGAWRLVVRGGGGTYAEELYGFEEDKYIRLVMQRNEPEQDGDDKVCRGERYAEYNPNPWCNLANQEAISFFDGNLEGVNYDSVPGGRTACETVSDAVPDGNPTGVNGLNCDFATFGTGVSLAQRTQFIVSVFIGEPEVDIETYRLLDAETT